MEEMRLKGDEAYFDALAAGRRKVLDNRTFKQPIGSIGMRACAILGESESVSAAIEAMRAARIGSVLVTRDGGLPVGIFTEPDAPNRLALGGKRPKNTP